MDESLRALAMRARIMGHDHLASLLEGALGHVEKIVADLTHAQSEQFSRQLQELGGTTLVGLAGDADALASELGLHDGIIVHDDTASYGSTLHETFDALRAPALPGKGEPRRDIVLETGRVLRVGFTSIRKFELDDSQSEPLLQAADALAALMTKAPSVQSELADSAPKLLDLYAGIAVLSIESYPNPRHFMGSEDYLTSALRPVSRLAATSR